MFRDSQNDRETETFVPAENAADCEFDECRADPGERRNDDIDSQPGRHGSVDRPEQRVSNTVAMLQHPFELRRAFDRE